MKSRILRPLIAYFTIVCIAHAQLQFTPAKCVDPTGFKTCWSKATSNANACYTKICDGGECINQFNCASNDPYCVQSCVCVAYRDWINCALSSCWNQVYSCAYQSLVVQAFMQCDIATVFPPYWPAPANAPGGCSCNIGGAYKAIRYYRDDQNVCNNYIDENGNSVKYHNQCDCCAYSGEISALPNICPNTDPASISFWADIEILNAASSVFPSCTAILADAICTAAPIGFPTPSLAPHGQFYQPGDVPAPGDQPLSNRPGSLGSPISGSILTWSLAKNALHATATARNVPPSE